jgi:ABC-type microcin C transport system permease subunit YejB
MNSLARFVAQRLMLLVLTLFAVSVLILPITQLLPGDVATMILGMQATPQDLATLRTQLGLDQPALVQFGRWLGGVLHGDLGMSTRFHRPVVEVLAPPLEKSLILALAGMAFAVPCGLALGLLCALRRDSLLDMTVSSVTMFAAGDARIRHGRPAASSCSAPGSDGCRLSRGPGARARCCSRSPSSYCPCSRCRSSSRLHQRMMRASVERGAR